jgi:hypothetical protein
MELNPYTVGEENVSADHMFACILCLHTPHLSNSIWLCDSLCHFIYAVIYLFITFFPSFLQKGPKEVLGNLDIIFAITAVELLRL